MYRKPISTGYLDGISHLIVQVEELGIKYFSDLIELAIADNIRLRGTWEVVINYSIEYEWIIIGPNEEISLGNGLKSSLLQKDFITLQRQLLWLFVRKQRPTWLRYAKNGLGAVKPHIIDDDERQVFRQLGLIPDSENNDIEVSKWWLRVSDLARNIIQEKNTETGIEGEFLTINYETRRTGVRPKHVAFESNNFGYDVLSQISNEDTSPLNIEVKSSVMMRKYASINLTRFEFEKSIEMGTSYIFHLWDLSGKYPLLLIVPSLDITKHTPKDTGSGKWEIVKIRFDVFDWTKMEKIEVDDDGKNSQI
jgi:hypothetical protein